MHLSSPTPQANNLMILLKVRWFYYNINRKEKINEKLIS